MWFHRESTPFRMEVRGDFACLLRYAGKDINVEVPQEFEGKPVREIGENAFYDQSKIVSVVLP